MLFHNEVHELGFRIRFAGEIAAKVRNKELARYFWSENDTGGTWELMYFIVNEERTDVPIQKVNPLFGYQPHYRPQGFSMINEEAVAKARSKLVWCGPRRVFRCRP
jgi:hypothetical protein